MKNSVTHSRGYMLNAIITCCRRFITFLIVTCAKTQSWVFSLTPSLPWGRTAYVLAYAVRLAYMTYGVRPISLFNQWKVLLAGLDIMVASKTSINFININTRCQHLIDFILNIFDIQIDGCMWWKSCCFFFGQNILVIRKVLKNNWLFFHQFLYILCHWEQYFVFLTM